MNNLLKYLDEFNKDMIEKFKEHDNKYAENSVMNDNWDINILFDEDYLRKEIHYHYAKWIYRGIEKKTLKEDDTLTNLANMIFLLWIKIKLNDKI
jgi:alpha-L-fucosidase